MATILTRSSRWSLPRRTFLKGLGTSLALPFLESMAPRALQAAAAAGGGANAGGILPRRTAFIYVPNGANMDDWTPAETGSNFKLPYILEPLQELREKVCVLTGLTHDKGRANGDGAGDHARASSSFLTAAQPRKTQGADIKVGISVDQYMAQRIGGQTALGSLELGCDRGQLSGNCDSGYSCAYSFNIAWRTESTPLPPETNPRLVFERMFGNGIARQVGERDAKRTQYNKSILDFVMDDARKLQSSLGMTDRRKLDEYMTAVRDLEKRIQNASKFASQLPNHAVPRGIPAENEEHIRLMYDLLLLAFQTDSTRIATFVVAHDGSNRPYPNIGVSDGHHDLSHHGNDKAKKEKIAKINRHHMSLFAEFLAKMKATQEGEGSVLDHSMIVYGSGLADGNEHAHHDLPVLLAGGGAGALRPGRHVRYPKETPMANLYLSLMDEMGVKADRFGDSTGRLGQLT